MEAEVRGVTGTVDRIWLERSISWKNDHSWNSIFTFQFSSTFFHFSSIDNSNDSVTSTHVFDLYTPHIHRTDQHQREHDRGSLKLSIYTYAEMDVAGPPPLGILRPLHP